VIDLADLIIKAFKAHWEQVNGHLELEGATREDDGVRFNARLYCPFSGSSIGEVHVTWERMVVAIGNPDEMEALKSFEEDEFEGESCGGGELAFDDNDIVHFSSDLEYQKNGGR
jgi:hypothetical protein